MLLFFLLFKSVTYGRIVNAVNYLSADEGLGSFSKPSGHVFIVIKFTRLLITLRRPAEFCYFEYVFINN